MSDDLIEQVRAAADRRNAAAQRCRDLLEMIEALKDQVSEARSDEWNAEQRLADLRGVALADKELFAVAPDAEGEPTVWHGKKAVLRRCDIAADETVRELLMLRIAWMLS